MPRSSRHLAFLLGLNKHIVSIAEWWPKIQFVFTACPWQETCHVFWLDRQYLGLCLISCFCQEKLAHSTCVWCFPLHWETFSPYVSKPQQLSLLQFYAWDPGATTWGVQLCCRFLHPTHPHLQPPLYFLCFTQLTFCRISTTNFQHRHRETDRTCIPKFHSQTWGIRSSSLPLFQSWLLYPAPLFQCAVCLSGLGVIILVFFSSQFWSRKTFLQGIYSYL